MEKPEDSPVSSFILTLALGTLDGSPLKLFCLCTEFSSLWKALKDGTNSCITQSPIGWQWPRINSTPPVNEAITLYITFRCSELFLCRVCELMFRFMSAQASINFWGTRLDQALLLSPAFQPHDASVIHAAWKSTTADYHLRPGSTWAMDMGVTILNNHCLAQKVSKMSDVGRMRGVEFWGERWVSSEGQAG